MKPDSVKPDTAKPDSARHDSAEAELEDQKKSQRRLYSTLLCQHLIFLSGTK